MTIDLAVLLHDNYDRYQNKEFDEFHRVDSLCLNERLFSAMKDTY